MQRPLHHQPSILTKQQAALPLFKKKREEGNWQLNHDAGAEWPTLPLATNPSSFPP